MSEEPVIGGDGADDGGGEGADEPVIGAPQEDGEAREAEVAALLRETLLAAHGDLSPDDLAGGSAEEVRERYLAARERIAREERGARRRARRCRRARRDGSPPRPPAPSRRSARGWRGSTPEAGARARRLGRGGASLTPAVTRTIEIVGYDPAWPETFASLSRALAAALGPLALRIEHVGSTSVPGLGAKPIIDLDVVIESPRTLPLVVEALNTLGYSHEGDGGIPGREAFGREGDAVPADGSGRVWPAHHLYVCPSGSEELRRHLRFRDHLRSHPDAAARYEALKRDLAHRYPDDIDSYAGAKSAFVERILALDGWGGAG